jgi:hypothetical protein
MHFELLVYWRDRDSRITNYTEQSNYWEADIVRSASQEIPHLLWNSKVH